MRIIYRGLDVSPFKQLEPEDRAIYEKIEDGIGIARGEIKEGVTPAQLAELMDAHPLAIFDVEPTDGKEHLGKLAVELERRGVSVHPDLGGSAQPKGHPRWVPAADSTEAADPSSRPVTVMRKKKR